MYYQEDQDNSDQHAQDAAGQPQRREYEQHGGDDQHDALQLAADPGLGQQAPQEVFDRRDRGDDQTKSPRMGVRKKSITWSTGHLSSCRGSARIPPGACLDPTWTYGFRL